MDPLAEIKKIYYHASRATIARDLARAVELLKTIGTEEERERAAVFMDGLSQMRSEWQGRCGARRAAAGPGCEAPQVRLAARRAVPAEAGDELVDRPRVEHVVGGEPRPPGDRHPPRHRIEPAP
jgi:hypothetical protein